jgi:RNA polymerase sigma factor (sigma-70 family)
MQNYSRQVHVSPRKGLTVAEFSESGREASVELTGGRRLEEEYQHIWAEYRESMVRLVYSYESLPHAREDLLQEIQLALWKALPSFRGECTTRTFVYRIAHNRALTHAWRQRKHVPSVESDLELSDPRPSPESTAIHNAEQSWLVDAIRRLPIMYRQVITMTLDELPQSEIAAVLGLTENNVAVRLNRARKLLRQVLGGKQ